MFDVANLPTPIHLPEVLGCDFVVIDFGCGMGHHTMKLADETPSWGILAIDVHTPGICNVVKMIAQENLTNIKVHLGDGLDILRDRLTPHTINEIHVLFPDPWPKPRHNKRRVIQPEFLRIAHRLLTDSGVLRIVTDDDSYADHVRHVLQSSEVMQEIPSDFVVPETRYHQRALRLGHTIHAFAATNRALQES